MGDPLDEATNFGPMVSAAAAGDRAGLHRQGREPRARGWSPAAPRSTATGFFLEPTVFADVTDDMTIARDEIFGPVMSVLDFDDEDEVLARANATPFGLAAGVFTRDLARAHRVVGAASRPGPAASTPTT